MNAVVTVRGLEVRFARRRVLDGLDFELPAGSVTALVGRNGAGKSTLLRVLVGALAPDAGDVRVLGIDPKHDGARVRRSVGYVADRFEVPSWIRGCDWLAFLARFYPTWSAAEAMRLCAVLELDVGARICELSKGNRTKLALVAALAHEPRVLLLDEPFAGLDVEARHAVTTAVLGSLREEARAVLLVSHSMRDVERVADRVAVLEGGRIVRSGELEAVALSPRGGIDLEQALAEFLQTEIAT